MAQIVQPHRLAFVSVQLCRVTGRVYGTESVAARLWPTAERLEHQGVSMNPAQVLPGQAGAVRL
jgi:hypothetical protein